MRLTSRVAAMTPFLRLRVLSKTCPFLGIMKLLTNEVIEDFTLYGLLRFAIVEISKARWARRKKTLVEDFHSERLVCKLSVRWFWLLLVWAYWYRMLDLIQQSEFFKSYVHWHWMSRDVKWDGSEKLSCHGMFLVLVCVDTASSSSATHHQHPVCRDVAAATRLSMRKTTGNHMTSDPFTRCASSISWCSRSFLPPRHWIKPVLHTKYGIQSSSTVNLFIYAALKSPFKIFAQRYQ